MGDIFGRKAFASLGFKFSVLSSKYIAKVHLLMSVYNDISCFYL